MDLSPEETVSRVKFSVQNLKLFEIQGLFGLVFNSRFFKVTKEIVNSYRQLLQALMVSKHAFSDHLSRPQEVGGSLSDPA